jgi:DNA-binding HxlR family transcriptional regulator
VRSYGQFCGLARALDVVGERWVLLIVRELLEEPRRYSELLEGLSGIASNLLVDRLRGMQEDGVVRRLEDGRYALTPWGQGLHEAVYALGRWAGPLMTKPRGDHAFRPNWLRHMVIARFEGVDPKRRDLVVELRCDGQVLSLVSSRGRVHLMNGPATEPDVTLSGPTEAVVALLLGRITRSDAEGGGVHASGRVAALTGLRPRGEAREYQPS